MIPDPNGHFAAAASECYAAMCELHTPAAIYRPRLFPDGNQWCALYGTDLQQGVAGFGNTPAEAMQAFNKAWFDSFAVKQTATATTKQTA